MSTHASFTTWDEPLRQAMHAHAEGKLDLAITHYTELLQRFPFLSRAAYNLGNIYKEIGFYEQAEDCFVQALGSEPDLFEAAQNLAFVLQEQGRFSDAVLLYQKILARWPGLPDPRFNLACLELLTGDFSNGWLGYEKRFECLANPVTQRHADIPTWNGSVTPGLRLLVHTEQGFGDSLQMYRYLPLISASDVVVLLETDPALAPFLSRGNEIAQCIVRGDAVPSVDAQIPMMSLPGLFKTDIHTIPKTYLPEPAAEKVSLWESLLPADGALRVGLCWSGRLDLPVNRKRSCPARYMQLLLDTPDCCFVSLQKDVAPKFALCDTRLLDFTDALHNFHDTAALISCLDLVITIDTAIAHLAGSMGKKTWLLLPQVPDWRWLLGRDDSPWYPSIRLFRQNERNAWKPVIQAVLFELTCLNKTPAEALTNAGAKLDEQGRHNEALHYYNKAILYRDDIAVTHYNKGNSLSALGKIDEARISWQQALTIAPDLVEALHNLAISYRDNGDIDTAHVFLHRALMIRPDDPELHHTQAELFQACDQLDNAIASFRKSLALHPERARTWNSLGTVYQSLEQDAIAESCYRQALKCDPGHLHARNNLGAVLLSQAKPLEAIAELEQLIAAVPDYYDAHWNLACALLAVGEWTRGWEEFEHRFLKHSPVENRHLEIPRWDGNCCLSGKTVLVIGEQAFGDTIQFARFIPLLKKRGARIILECQASPLLSLMSNIAGVDYAICRGDNIPKADYSIPLLSLPLLLKISSDSLCDTVPYLTPTTASREQWKQLLFGDSNLKVGICWWGRQTLRNRRRSCSPELLSPLATITGVTLYRLQLGEDIPEPPFPLVDHTDKIHNFSDTAGLISCLDLVITIDTAVAHLSGALGIPVWLMLPVTGDWRWMTNRTDSLWYPSMRIFRQQEEGDWQAVIRLLLENLQHLVCTKAPDNIKYGDMLREQEDWQAAFDSYTQITDNHPDYMLAQLRAGGCLMFLNRHSEAAAYFNRVIALQPNAPDAHVNLAICHLSCGSWQYGWQEFEWRRQYITDPLPPFPELPDLQPDDRLDGISVLVHCEQGFGDMLQFSRYLPVLTQLGANVVFSVPPELARLFLSLGHGITIVPHGKLLPKADQQALLMSLPGKLYKLHPTPLACEGYLTPPHEVLEAARRHTTSSLPGLKIGLAWQGRNLGKSGYRRSLDPEILKPLLELKGCSFVSLHPQLVGQPHPAILDISDQISDFADTAALMANLDLVITVDTAVAHLAGALGIPCWTALLHSPDWRWFPLSATSKWYPSMRLYRQPKPGDWYDVVQQMVNSLMEELETRNAHRLIDEGRELEALDCFRRATSHPNASAAAWLNLGTALFRIGETEEARKSLKQAIQIAPDYPEAWQNLGLVQQGLGEFSEAYLCYRHALRLRPDYPTALWNFSLLQLLLGDYQRGFSNYEARFDKTPPVPRLHQHIPLWDGSKLHGKRLLVHAEQGYGDTIQFCRYLPILSKTGVHIVFEVQDQSLVELMRSLACPIEITVRGDITPQADMQVPLLSLPRLLGTSIDDIPADVPYLGVNQVKVAAWRQMTTSFPGHKVGLVWQGSRKHANDRFRSCPPEFLQPLSDLPNFTWFILQPDVTTGIQLPLTAVDLTKDIHDFSDSAALIANMDLVISVDTAIAHLAGALGKNVWLLLPFAPDWRWGATEETTTWYPSIRIFRQKPPQDWQGIFSTLIMALAELANE